MSSRDVVETYIAATRRPAEFGDKLKSWIAVGASPRGSLALGPDMAVRVSVVMKRVAMVEYGRARVASLTGRAWLDFVVETASGTTDLDLARGMLRDIVVGMAGPRTAIGLGIGLFDKSTVKAKTIIALTDGNDTASKVPPAEAAGIARDRGIVIHTVAVGDPRRRARTGEPAGSTQGQSMRFTAAVPPAIDPSGPVLAAAGVEAGESWSPDPASASFKAGGAITRTIRRRAAGVPALGMAEFRFTAPDGVCVYVDPPEIDDKVNRGEVEGARTDKVTYVFERPGIYALPGLSQPWWDTARKQARSESLAGATITVTASDAAGRGPAASGGRWIAIAAGLVVLLALFAVRPRLAAILHRWRDRHRASAAFARKVLMETASGGDVAATYSALGVWLQRLPATAREAVGKDPRIRALHEKLDRALFGPDGSWSAHDGALLAQSLAQLPPSVSGERRLAEPALPPLNPSGVPEPFQEDNGRKASAA